MKKLLFPGFRSKALIFCYSDDCKKIGELCGIRATGFAYPYGEYNAETVKQLKSLGIIYARTVNDTHRFDLPADFWNGTPPATITTPK